MIVHTYPPAAPLMRKKRKKRKNENPCGNRNQYPRIQPRGFRQSIGDQNHHGAFEKVIIESAQKTVSKTEA
jgi:hypothetical protein